MCELLQVQVLTSYIQLCPMHDTQTLTPTLAQAKANQFRFDRSTLVTKHPA